jgi:hypothetical protein
MMGKGAARDLEFIIGTDSSNSGATVPICCMCIVHIYNKKNPCSPLLLYIYIYIGIYICVCVYMHLYKYVHIHSSFESVVFQIKVIICL